MSRLAVLCHNPELFSYKSIANRNPAGLAGFAADRFQESAAWNWEANRKQKLHRWIEQVLLKKVHYPTLHHVLLIAPPISSHLHTRSRSFPLQPALWTKTENEYS